MAAGSSDRAVFPAPVGPLLRSRQVTLPEAAVLWAVSSIGDWCWLSYDELAARTGLSKSTVQRVIDELVRRDLLERKRHTSDKRRVAIRCADLSKISVNLTPIPAPISVNLTPIPAPISVNLTPIPAPISVNLTPKSVSGWNRVSVRMTPIVSEEQHLTADAATSCNEDFCAEKRIGENLGESARAAEAARECDADASQCVLGTAPPLAGRPATAESPEEDQPATAKPARVGSNGKSLKPVPPPAGGGFGQPAKKPKAGESPEDREFLEAAVAELERAIQNWYRSRTRKLSNPSHALHEFRRVVVQKGVPRERVLEVLRWYAEACGAQVRDRYLPQMLGARSIGTKWEAVEAAYVRLQAAATEWYLTPYESLSRKDRERYEQRLLSLQDKLVQQFVDSEAPGTSLGELKALPGIRSRLDAFARQQGYPGYWFESFPCSKAYAEREG